MSILKVNTINGVGGGGSTVKNNNDSTYISEGGAVTDSNLVQGLCKTWCDYNAQADGTGNMSLADSFNIASLTDNGTGDYTFAHTNDMASGDYVFVGGSQYETGAIGSVTTIRIKSGSSGNKAAATMRVQSEYSNTSGNCTPYDYAQQQFAVHGDLA
tara:strand:+ start:396 stop:866 length:471 start_codon:yes stop_codon:yes gene_type:complete